MLDDYFYKKTWWMCYYFGWYIFDCTINILLQLKYMLKLIDWVLDLALKLISNRFVLGSKRGDLGCIIEQNLWRLTISVGNK